MSTAVHGESGNFWNKFKTSTKSISSSFSQLSVKPELDGDSPTSTIVHKALVKHYKNQEPFTGFPSWLGHKEDLPNEQKILKKQTEHLEKQQRVHEKQVKKEQYPSGFTSLRRAATSVTESVSQTQDPQRKSVSYERRSRPSDAFQGIYNSESPESYAKDSSTTSVSSTDNNIPSRSSSGRINRLGRPSWSQASGNTGNQENTRPELTSQSSLLMTERLRRKTRT
ncbi:similar to Saccharomyces cerevisiae YNR049C MSO1 Probable component of the secretory vesicle docking complex, acts at a late step in secretion [Maudiozyma barnettii]|uniref:Similar to Saccharomyces cerevisiae YNR049C MSO1 Probable component of the secretory vesicle docking complex, acts at a late step in secretion n=1 Tax=Maudiozyma barnettii TaxID=61262 RepID=A0A8H2ZIE4_9SACH|nr:Mso1p [Kazachstania barnettii]CAB4255437.1 similar to Saccharomyces cerevisiae YNR049C MSO1 Probable component of the secretory vesicle docking complex, acts at a late step in secretion [Kazachstania barnettii]CAD1783877.1 similar to Saccharomyces cerevisiae YNR049C MSO1 Probable component of the secretory vesicle docking complex, acts at a late step in secretion [Kazachstania barnettii]